MKVKYFDNKPLKSFNPLVAYANVMMGLPSVVTNFKTFAVIIKEFFFLQFFEKFHIIHIPVVHVDHPLDDKVPFIPSKVTIYLDFINLWVRPLAMLVKKFGHWHACVLTKKWMRLFRKLYRCAGQIYHFRLTTTNRPDYNEMWEFRQIHTWDPHFLCVPSLHIATVALAYAFYRKIFSEEAFSESEKANWLKELYDSAVQIADTVLYVKQHSVNCIPAAIYLLTANFGDLFTVDDAEKFINDMFTEPDGFSIEDASLVKNHIRNTFRNYCEQGKSAENWYEPVHEFLINYETK